MYVEKLVFTITSKTLDTLPYTIMIIQEKMSVCVFLLLCLCVQLASE